MGARASIVIPTYNGERFIQEAIDSVLAQTEPCEIVVVDDGSTDSTKSILDSYGERLVRVSTNRVQVGAARNAGLRRATASYLGLLDHDDVFAPTKVEQQIAALKADSSASLVATGVWFFNERDGVTQELPVDDLLDAHELLAFRPITVQSCLFRREVVDRTGGFNPQLAPADDWDFTIRAADQFRCIGISDVLVGRRGHPGQQSVNQRMMLQRCRKVVRMRAPLHSDCADCADAVRQAECRLREFLSDWLREEAHRSHNARKLRLQAEMVLRNPQRATRALRRRLVRRNAP